MKKIAVIGSYIILTALIIGSLFVLLSDEENKESPRIKFIQPRVMEGELVQIKSYDFNFQSTRFELVGDKILIWNYTKRKILVLDRNLNKVGEFGQSGNGPADLLRVTYIGENEAGDQFVVFDSENGAFKYFDKQNFQLTDYKRIKGSIRLDRAVHVSESKFIINLWGSNNTLEFALVDANNGEVIDDQLELNSFFQGIDNSAIIYEGFFAKNECNEFFFASYQSPHFYQFDSSGKSRYVQQPIYSTPEPEIFSSDGITAPINGVSHLTQISADCDHVYLLSNIGDSEGRRVIDIYTSSTGNYLRSVSAPELDEDNPIGLSIQGQQVFLLYNNSIVSYKLQ